MYSGIIALCRAITAAEGTHDFPSTGTVVLAPSRMARIDVALVVMYQECCPVHLLPVKPQSDWQTPC